MTIRVGINGFRRMGRLALRAGWGMKDLEFVHINEVKGGVATAAHLLEFDSIHGKWPHTMSSTAEALKIEDKALRYTELKAPGEVPWRDSGVDIVLECSGKFRTRALLDPYYKAGVRKVIVAAPVKEESALNVVMGVNDHLYRPDQHDLLTAASCTTN